MELSLAVVYKCIPTMDWYISLYSGARMLVICMCIHVCVYDYVHISLLRNDHPLITLYLAEHQKHVISLKICIYHLILHLTLTGQQIVKNM